MSRWKWFKWAIVDLLFAGGVGCILFKRYPMGIILIFISLIYRKKYVY